MPAYKVYAGGYQTSKYGIIWMHYEVDCPLPEIVKIKPHTGAAMQNMNIILGMDEGTGLE